MVMCRVARFLSFTLCSLLALSLVFTTHAQFNAGLQGTVTDSSGAVVPDATVTLTNQETRRQQKTQTSGEGFYRFSGLAPGQYNVSIEKTGFKKFTREGIPVNAEKLEGSNFTLEMGEVTESVTVSGGGVAVLQTEQADIGRTMTRSEIEHLPQLNR